MKKITLVTVCLFVFFFFYTQNKTGIATLDFPTSITSQPGIRVLKPLVRTWKVSEKKMKPRAEQRS